MQIVNSFDIPENLLLLVDISEIAVNPVEKDSITFFGISNNSWALSTFDTSSRNFKISLILQTPFHQ
jgi:hypothetical protein